MSRRGEIAIECDAEDCWADICYTELELFSALNESLIEDGWVRKDGKDYCPECSAPVNPRERGDDDGTEYADPRDHREGRK